MITKTIYRNPCTISESGDIGSSCLPAEPVVDPLIITTDVAILRGEWILDDQGYEWATISVSGPNTNSYTPGKVAVITGTSFEKILCIIDSIQLDCDFDSALSSVSLSVRIIK